MENIYTCRLSLLFCVIVPYGFLPCVQSMWGTKLHFLPETMRYRINTNHFGKVPTYSILSFTTNSILTIAWVKWGDSFNGKQPASKAGR